MLLPTRKAYCLTLGDRCVYEPAKPFTSGDGAPLAGIDGILTFLLRSFVSVLWKKNEESENYEFAPFLARGLSYYTGTIFEVEVEGYDAGSVAGGGRYDLILIGAQRLRELKRQHREDTSRYVTCVDALIEVQNGQVNLTDYLAKVK